MKKIFHLYLITKFIVKQDEILLNCGSIARNAINFPAHVRFSIKIYFVLVRCWFHMTVFLSVLTNIISELNISPIMHFFFISLNSSDSFTYIDFNKKFAKMFITLLKISNKIIIMYVYTVKSAYNGSAYKELSVIRNWCPFPDLHPSLFYVKNMDIADSDIRNYRLEGTHFPVPMHINQS